jgi:hypothetical protein
MSKKLGNTNLDKVNIKELQGFEDVFEDYIESEEYKEFERKEKSIAKTAEQYEMQNFLEQENARLTALEIFLSKKVDLREKLSLEFQKSDSQFQKNLSFFFNSHFS